MLDNHKGGIGATATILRLCQSFQVNLFKGAHGWYFGRMRTLCAVTNKVASLYPVS